MLKVCFLTTLFIAFFFELSTASTIELNSGKTIQGRILENTPTKVTVDFNGTTLTYFKDEIKSITEDEPDPLNPPIKKKITYKVTKTIRLTTNVDLETLQFNSPLSRKGIKNLEFKNVVIFPKPNAVTTDPDGNEIATFYYSHLKAGETHEIIVDFDVDLNELDLKVDRKRILDSYNDLSAEQRSFMSVKDASAEEEQLAKDLTKGIVNPYDKAKAIYDYLVTHFSYENVKNISGRQQTYGTLTGQKGNCRDISRLFLILARLSGIPTKEVDGLAFQPKDSSKVCQTNAGHAWNEIYLPGYQWQPVDATFGLTEPKRFFVFPYEIHIPECYGDIFSSDLGSLYDGSSISVSSRGPVSANSVQKELGIEIEQL